MGSGIESVGDDAGAKLALVSAPISEVSPSGCEGSFFKEGLTLIKDTMGCAARMALAVLCFTVLPLPARGQQQIMSPSLNQPGYTSTKTRDDDQPAPDGYEGRTETGERTWLGNTPATAGRRFVTDFTLGNEIKVCPKADGTAEGDGQFALTAKYTDTQGNAGTVIMRADAKYKGQVGDDALLDGLVTADIAYSYSVTGNFPDTSGAIFTPGPIYVEQHIKIEMAVTPGMNPPKIGAMSGGDPTQSHYAEAYGAGMALTFWGGVYFGFAETRWTHGECVDVAFDPPSRTVQPALGTQVAVKTQLKTKTGEITKASYTSVTASVGSVDSAGGVSDVGTPMTFTYTAPDQKPASASPSPGFSVNAVSRAGATGQSAKWEAVLGTGWSGIITCRRETWGDEGHDDLQDWSGSEVMMLSLTVRDGVGTLTGHGEQKSMGENRQRVVNSGVFSFKKENSSFSEGTAGRSSPATVNVDIYQGKYSVTWGASKSIAGKRRVQTCEKDSCKDYTFDYGVDPGNCTPGGDLTDPNRLQGSLSDMKSSLGRSKKGKQLWTLSWNLARQGTTK